MFADLFHALLEWIQQNPTWAYVGVFFTAALESLAIVGLFLPGAVIMFGVGALVAAGALELWPTLVWAAVGAVAGDGFSFWLGRHYHQRLRVIWPFSRYPALMNRGVDFFHRHGGKRVILARFIGPVRPILPAVAGMLDMPPQRFFLVNALSAILWAPAYTLPGVVFGASLGLAAEVAGRLAVLILVLVTEIWFGIWLVRRALRSLQPRADFLLTRLLDWGQQRRWAEPLVGSLLDPTHPEARGLATLVVLLAVLSLASTWLLAGWLGGVDRVLFQTLQELRTPFADQILVMVTGLGDMPVLMGVLLCGSAWLLLRGRTQAALHWVAAAVSCMILTHLLKIVIAAPRPMGLYDGVSAYSFPSSHASLSVAVYGFLAVLIARELSPARRWIPYIGAALLVIPISFTRLYLGAHWLSDVLAGLALGLACLALFGIAYRRHPAKALGWPSLLLITLVALITLDGWRTGIDLHQEVSRYTSPRVVHSVSTDQWWRQDWQQLPAQRQDFKAQARQPLTLQFAGDLSVLAKALSDRGWQIPNQLSATTALQWLSPHPDQSALPVLPQVHDGLHEELRLLRYSEDGQHLYVLRLWPTNWQLTEPAAPLWVGNVTELQLHQRLYLFSYLITAADSQPALELFRQDAATVCDITTQHRAGSDETVLLLRAHRRTLNHATAPPV